MQQLLLKKQQKQLTLLIKELIWCRFKQLDNALDKLDQVEVKEDSQLRVISNNNKCNNYPQKWSLWSKKRGHHNKSNKCNNHQLLSQSQLLLLSNQQRKQKLQLLLYKKLHQPVNLLQRKYEQKRKVRISTLSR